MQQFSDAFKQRLVRRLVGPHAMSANALAEEVGVSQESLSRWLRAARSVGGMTPASKKSYDHTRPLGESGRNGARATHRFEFGALTHRQHQRIGRGEHAPHYNVRPVNATLVTVR